ncbi:hypothetical protein GCM10010129_11830 [Streptomyces fumigatiscleroticus]|nr:hypothetical protein GCM10010129_11830 [Streptomyces fumigatiscleroticus]
MRLRLLGAGTVAGAAVGVPAAVLVGAALAADPAASAGDATGAAVFVLCCAVLLIPLRLPLSAGLLLIPLRLPLSAGLLPTVARAARRAGEPVGPEARAPATRSPWAASIPSASRLRTSSTCPSRSCGTGTASGPRPARRTTTPARSTA